jgi:hypothetical protein
MEGMFAELDQIAPKPRDQKKVDLEFDDTVLDRSEKAALKLLKQVIETEKMP